MVIFQEIKNGRKSYRTRKVIKTKIKFQEDGFYECLGLSCWAKYSKYIFRIEEIYYFLGLRDLLFDINTLESTPFKEIIIKMIPYIKKDFKKVLLEAQEFYNLKNNYHKYYKWSCGR